MRSGVLFRLLAALCAALLVPLFASAAQIYTFSGYLDKEVNAALYPSIRFGDRFTGTLILDESIPTASAIDNGKNVFSGYYTSVAFVEVKFGEIETSSVVDATVNDAYAPDLYDGIGFHTGGYPGSPAVNGYQLVMLQLRLYTLQQDYWDTVAIPSPLPSLDDVSPFWFSGFWTSWNNGTGSVFASGTFDYFAPVAAVSEPSSGGLVLTASLLALFIRRKSRIRIARA